MTICKDLRNRDQDLSQQRGSLGDRFQMRTCPFLQTGVEEDRMSDPRHFDPIELQKSRHASAASEKALVEASRLLLLRSKISNSRSRLARHTPPQACFQELKFTSTGLFGTQRSSWEIVAPGWTIEVSGKVGRLGRMEEIDEVGG